MERKHDKRSFGKKDSNRKSDDFVNYFKPDRKQKFDKSEKRDKPFKPKFDKKEDKPYGKSKFGLKGLSLLGFFRF